MVLEWNKAACCYTNTLSMLGWFNLRNSETLRYKTEGAGLTAKNIYVYAVSSNVFHDDASTHDLLVPKSGGSAVRLD